MPEHEQDRLDRAADVIEKLADVARCTKQWATAMVVVEGAASWGRCVRLRGHEGDHVIELSLARTIKLQTLRRQARAHGDAVDRLALLSEIKRLEGIRDAAEAAWLT
jgi:hypothetical protein